MVLRTISFVFGNSKGAMHLSNISKNRKKMYWFFRGAFLLYVIILIYLLFFSERYGRTIQYDTLLRHLQKADFNEEIGLKSLHFQKIK